MRSQPSLTVLPRDERVAARIRSARPARARFVDPYAASATGTGGARTLADPYAASATGAGGPVRSGGEAVGLRCAVGAAARRAQPGSAGDRVSRRRRAILLLGLALLLGGLAAAHVARREAALEAELGPLVDVVVASRDLAAGRGSPRLIWPAVASLHAMRPPAQGALAGRGARPAACGPGAARSRRRRRSARAAGGTAGCSRAPRGACAGGRRARLARPRRRGRAGRRRDHPRGRTVRLWPDRAGPPERRGALDRRLPPQARAAVRARASASPRRCGSPHARRFAWRRPRCSPVSCVCWLAPPAIAGRSAPCASRRSPRCQRWERPRGRAGSARRGSARATAARRAKAAPRASGCGEDRALVDREAAISGRGRERS